MLSLTCSANVWPDCCWWNCFYSCRQRFLSRRHVNDLMDGYGSVPGVIDPYFKIDGDQFPLGNTRSNCDAVAKLIQVGTANTCRLAACACTDPCQQPPK